MNLLLARTTLVVGAFGLVGTGVLAPVPGASRAVVIAAGLVFAVLDRLVVAGERSQASRLIEGRQQLGAETLPTESETLPTESETRPPQLASPAPDEAAALLLGHRLDDGSPVHSAGAHLVVVGRGALARAVFDALSTRLVTVAAIASTDATTGPAGTSTSRHSDDLPDGLAPLPEGTAVHVVVPDGSRALRPGGEPALRTLVLVPDHDRTPRRADAIVTVGRSGCTVRTASESPIRIAPVLPLLDLPAERSEALPAELAEALPSAAQGLSADRHRRGRHRPGRLHRAPARPWPP